MNYKRNDKNDCKNIKEDFGYGSKTSGYFRKAQQGKKYSRKY
nr:hypothetical protein [Marinilabilia rubra]